MQVNALNCSAVYLLECNQPLTGSFCLTIRILAQEELNKLDRFTLYKAAFGRKASSMLRVGGIGRERGWKSGYSHNISLLLMGIASCPFTQGMGPESLTSGDCSSVIREQWSVDEMHLLPMKPAPA